MITKQDVDFQISSINELYDDFIVYVDSINITDSNELVYVTSDTLLSAVKKCKETSIQSLEEQKRDSLTEYSYTSNSDSTLFNICFEIYGTVNEENIEQLIVANDLQALNRLDINPMNPMIKKNTKIIYYK